MEGSKITGIKDVDKLKIQNMDVRTFLNTYRINNKYVHSLFDENVFRQRVEKEFPRLISLKPKSFKWKKYYLSLVRWSHYLKENFNFESNDFRNHPIKYISILDKLNKLKNEEYLLYSDFTFEEYKSRIMNEILRKASLNGYLDIVKFAIDNGANDYQRAMNSAAFYGQMETFEYLRNNIPFEYNLNEALDKAQADEKNTEMIKHIQDLIERNK